MAKTNSVLWAVLWCVCLTPGLSALTQTKPSMPEAAAAPAIVIGPGDVLDVEVFDTLELSQPTARVSQAGQVNLPVLGQVQIAGLNADQAARRIESQLRGRGIMLQPHVTVTVVEYATQGATILGEVRTPGVYPTFGDRRLLDVIALAGGFQPSAGKIVTIAHRLNPQHPQIIRLVQKAQALGRQENPVVQPGDTIVVGRAGIVYILGAVNKAGGFLIDNNEHISLMQALTLAGGWNQAAALSKARLVRAVPGGHEQITLDLKRILEGKQADINVEDGDIVYLPMSLGKTLAYRGMEAIIAAAQTAVVYSSSTGTF